MPPLPEQEPDPLARAGHAASGDEDWVRAGPDPIGTGAVDPGHDNEANSPHVLVVDDHPMVSAAMGVMLQRLYPAAHVEIVASLGAALQRLSDGRGYDLVVLDLGLQDAQGLLALERVRAARPDCSVVIWSAELHAPTILECIRLGACGYIPKTLSHEQTRLALQAVFEGNIFVPKDVHRRANVSSGQHNHQGPERIDPRTIGLTDRQIEVLRLIILGRPNKIICRELGLAPGTLKNHVGSILRILGVKNRTEAVIAAGRLDLSVGDRRSRP